MALQSFSAPNATSTGNSTVTDLPPPPAGTLNPGSSIPFSFLIAFIALFLFFLGCGLGTRRAAVVFRRNLGLNDSAAQRSRRVEVVKPAIWDAWPEVDERNESERWSDIQPLAFTLIREKSQEDRTFSPRESRLPNGAISPVGEMSYFPSRGAYMTTTPVPPISRTPVYSGLSRAAVPPDHIPANIHTDNPGPNPTRRHPEPPPTNIFHRIYTSVRNSVYTLAIMNGFRIGSRQRVRTLDNPEPPKPVEGVQVTVLVVMPSVERKLREKLKRESQDIQTVKAGDEAELGVEFGELVVGTTKLPWSELEGSLGDWD
ncbi:hypothetical protein BXZ70DRAFT_767015 [Cristinia sonorae]|uniref:Uncharacterized protein n=1 Tax=Cristinia sonorae TaxID=1940300 RepID=A0A8K0UTH4_9AGAR|nr:hypothetical protein BXZ70DRAFT_767015 [Cristinia sonorae]